MSCHVAGRCLPSRLHVAEWQCCGQADVGVRGPAPDVGEHTDSVLREAGLSEAELAALKEVGAVGAATDQMKGPLATWMQGAAAK